MLSEKEIRYAGLIPSSLSLEERQAFIRGIQRLSEGKGLDGVDVRMAVLIRDAWAKAEIGAGGRLTNKTFPTDGWPKVSRPGPSTSAPPTRTIADVAVDSVQRVYNKLTPAERAQLPGFDELLRITRQAAGETAQGKAAAQTGAASRTTGLVDAFLSMPDGPVGKANPARQQFFLTHKAALLNSASGAYSSDPKKRREQLLAMHGHCALSGPERAKFWAENRNEILP